LGRAIIGSMPDTFPFLRAVTFDATNAREVAEFWRQLLGFEYRSGDEPPPEGQPDPNAEEWLVLRNRSGEVNLCVQPVGELAAATWPDPKVPQQLHLELTVGDLDELAAQHDRALALGASVLEDRSTDEEEPLYVFADPAGHPFCIFVSPSHPK
jgi:hypothetical protein